MPAGGTREVGYSMQRSGHVRHAEKDKVLKLEAESRETS